MTNKFESKKIKLDKLILDTRNPRFNSDLHGANLKDAEQKEIMEHLLELYDVSSIAKSICDHGGFHGGTRIICIKENDKYIVKEGNRRVTACKLLTNKNLTDKISEKFPQASKETIKNIQLIDVDLYQNVDDLLSVLESIHTQGAKQWGSKEKAKFYVDAYESCNGDLDKLFERFNKNKSDVKKAITNYNSYIYTIKLLNEKHKDCKYNDNYLPLVERGIKNLIKNLGIIYNSALKFNLDESKIELFNEMIIKLGEAFLIDKTVNSSYISNYENFCKVVENDELIPGLKNLIMEYKGVNIPYKNNQKAEKNSQELKKKIRKN